MSAGEPELFLRAGQEGAIVLTQLLSQSVDTLGKNIASYRRAWAESGTRGAGRVAVILHTLVGDDEEAVKEAVREPMKAYLKGDLSLVRDAAWEFPAFQEMAEEGKTLDDFFAQLSERGMDELLEFAFDRSYATGGLLGRARAAWRRRPTEGNRRRRDRLPGRFRRHGRAGSRASATFERAEKCGESERRRRGDRRADRASSCDARGRRAFSGDFLNLERPQPERYPTRESADRRRRIHVGRARPSAPVVGRWGVINAYGSVETTIWSTAHELTEEKGSVSIGKPLANTRVYVMDERQQLLPIGVPGELVLSGDGLARGYLNNPELTDACFLKNERRRIYRTGDLVRMRRDGVLEFVGRLDHLVKIRGNHINLPDIESVLQALPASIRPS